MQSISNKIWKNSISVMIGLVLLVTVFLFNSKAANVVVTQSSDGPLTFIKINGGGSDSWASSGTFSQADGKYTLNTNSYTFWYEKDNADFAYQKYYFNYGTDAVLTVDTYLNSWNGTAATASAGLLIRSSLDPGAASAFIHWRPEDGGLSWMLYRMKDGGSYAEGPKESVSSPPIAFRLVLTKKQITGYYKVPGNDNWIKLSKSVPFTQSGNDVYVGLGAHSADRSQVATANYTGFNVLVEAPEGYSSSSGSSSDGSSEPPVPEALIPEDLPVSDDVLLRETFTDNSMKDGTASITNPIWETENEDPPIVTTPDVTNRYLNLYFDNNYYVTGNRTWTDYSTSMDVTFDKQSLPGAKNRFSVYVRHNDTYQYGYHDYEIRFMNGNKISIIKRNWGTTFLDSVGSTTSLEVASADLSYLNEESLGTLHQLRIETLDNNVKVYWDNTAVLTYTDNTYSKNLTGCIALYTEDAAVQIDNITVRTLTDLLGGDYDNKIGGNFNDPIPDYIKDNIAKGLPY